jgi:tRNA-splicing ligase RtcB
MTNSERNYEVLETPGRPVKAWIKGVAMEPAARQQLANIASLPFIHKWVAAMPDVHLGKGATVGSVIATHKAIIPAAVGVDIGCGMMAVQTTLTASDLPDGLGALRSAIEKVVPHGRTGHGARGDRGAWHNPPPATEAAWAKLLPRYDALCEKHRALKQANHVSHLGTLGTGNHFIEVCLDETQQVWVMLHSGSRGVGNRIGSHFIELAKREMERWFIQLPDTNLAYLSEGSQHFDDYVEAVSWAQEFAAQNRELMMQAVLGALHASPDLPEFSTTAMAVNCHHNYVSREKHYDANVLVTRKGAVRAQEGELGIIPGSMGTRSYIVRGKGNPESFCSCSHGAGRSMSRTAARKQFTVADQIRATEGVECRKDEDVIDEIPMAYKDIDAVMAAQQDLVDVVHTLKQVLCVKG